MAAGLLILLIGVFVWRAKPDSRLHQLFFALALADGVSTFAFNLALSPVDENVRMHAFLAYYYGFLGFLALLLAFAGAFPRPMLPDRRLRVAAVGLAAAFLVLALLQGLDHTRFWIAYRSNGVLAFALTPGGRLVATVFVLTTAFILLRATFLLRNEPSPSHRLQGALVLGGMALGYAPFSTTVSLVGFSDGMARTYFSPQWDVSLTYWAAFFTFLCVLAAAGAVFIESRPDRRTERNIALACLGGVLALTLLSLFGASRTAADRMQTLAVLFYPILLGYAIARYEVLDIDAQVRRAAAASFLGAGFTAAFLLFEVFLEQILETVLAVGVSATLVAGIAAALLTAVISVPLARAARKAAARLVPTLSETDIALRKREIYRHALAGAAMDGVIAPHELRVLQRLRESLEISEAEHTAIMREVGGAA